MGHNRIAGGINPPFLRAHPRAHPKEKFSILRGRFNRLPLRLAPGLCQRSGQPGDLGGQDGVHLPLRVERETLWGVVSGRWALALVGRAFAP